jgi:hypothetical protein
MLHRFPEQGLIHRAEYFLGQLDGAYLLATQIHYINRRHNVFSLAVSHRLSAIRQTKTAEAPCSAGAKALTFSVLVRHD